VVAAAKSLRDAGLGAQKVPAVRADVRKPAQRAGGVAREQQRLVHEAFEQGEGQHRAGGGGALRAVDELPASGEHALADALEGGRVAIEGRGQRARAADVLVDHGDIVSQVLTPA